VKELHAPARRNFLWKRSVSRCYELWCEIMQDSSSRTAWSWYQHR